MKYLGEERQIEIKTVIERPIEYIRCDKCNKKILPFKYSVSQNKYIRVHTWHSDWGNDSIESHEYHDYCPKCAKEIVSAYIDEMKGSEELELSNEYLHTNQSYRGNVPLYGSGLGFVENDKLKEE